MNTVLTTFAALIAFAGNSVLCRLALKGGAIDASSFTVVRLLSGAMTLLLILLWSCREQPLQTKGSWRASIYLFVYALGFSYAYLTLETGMGALILFGAVQLTIILISLLRGQRLVLPEWAGIVMAFGGFVYLVWPTLSTPSWLGFVLMSMAGIAWGAYTLAGKGSLSPLQDTAFNFIRTLPLLVVLAIWMLWHANLSLFGVGLAVLSGALASGIGYTLWYMALSKISALQAGVLQLSVPLIAAVGGVIFASEAFTIRLVIASGLILGGTLLVLVAKSLFKRVVNPN